MSATGDHDATDPARYREVAAAGRASTTDGWARWRHRTTGWFGGFGFEETALCLEGVVDTVMRDWTLAKAWLLRPALILQNDVGTLHSPVTIVATLTSNVLRRGPTSVLVNAPEGGLTVDSVILLNQIRTIDERRLVKRIGVLRTATVDQVGQAILISLALIEM